MEWPIFRVRKEYHAFGYRWVINKLSDVYIVKLKLNNCFRTTNCGDYTSYEDYLTTDCVVEDIFRLRDNLKVPRLLNGAIYAFNYRVGERIKGHYIFFYPFFDQLLKNQEYNIKKHLEMHIQIMRMVNEYNSCDHKSGKDYLKKRIHEMMETEKPKAPDNEKFVNMIVIDEPTEKKVIPDQIQLLLDFDSMSHDEMEERIRFYGIGVKK